MTTTPAPPTTSGAGVASGAGCVGCHTDEDTLRLLAVEPAATEVLSEGEG